MKPKADCCAIPWTIRNSEISPLASLPVQLPGEMLSYSSTRQGLFCWVTILSCTKKPPLVLLYSGSVWYYTPAFVKGGGGCNIFLFRVCDYRKYDYLILIAYSPFPQGLLTPLPFLPSFPLYSRCVGGYVACNG